MVARHRAFLSDKDIRGRVWISAQGINSQAGGVKEEVTAYADWVAAQPEFLGLRYTLWPATGAKGLGFGESRGVAGALQRQVWGEQGGCRGIAKAGFGREGGSRGIAKEGLGGEGGSRGIAKDSLGRNGVTRGIAKEGLGVEGVTRGISKEGLGREGGRRGINLAGGDGGGMARVANTVLHKGWGCGAWSQAIGEDAQWVAEQPGF